MIKRILICLFVISCRSVTKSPEFTPSMPNVPISPIPALQTLKTHPGQVVLLRAPIERILNQSELVCEGKSYPYHIDKGELIAYIGIDYFSHPRTIECIINHPIDPTSSLLAVIHVKDKTYPSEAFSVNKKRVVLSEQDQKRVQKEEKILKSIYGKLEPIPLFATGFVAPLQSKITSHYGTKRVFNSIAKSQHLGTDFRAAVGVPIPVSNSGIVVYAGDLFYTGNTVIVSHGLGVFTMYGHLSSLNVNPHQKIKIGDIVGLSGATGRVSGPHLHWGVKVANLWVDGFSLIQETSFVK